MYLGNVPTSVTLAAVRSMVVVLFLLIDCLLLRILIVYVFLLFCIAVLCVLSSFADISLRKRKLVALPLPSYAI